MLNNYNRKFKMYICRYQNLQTICIFTSCEINW